MKTIFLKGLCGLSLVMIPEAVLASSKDNLKSVSPHQYTHLIETYQSQTFGPLSQPALFLGQAATVLNYPRVAKVHFITNDSGQVYSGIGSGNNSGGIGFDDPTAEQCKGEDYKITSCENGTPADVCPYNSSYFKECCDSSYNYTEENCSLLNTTSSCGKKYQCDCTLELYPVTEGSCDSPQVPGTGDGKSCRVNGETRYTECVCPESYGETCTGTHQQGKGVGCSKNGETKYASCECASGYTLTCSQNGASPANPSDYCLVGGKKYYNNCKECENECSLAECPTGISCRKEACSGKFCDVGCAIDQGYQDLDNYWCDGALRCLVK